MGIEGRMGLKVLWLIRRWQIDARVDAVSSTRVCGVVGRDKVDLICMEGLD